MAFKRSAIRSRLSPPERTTKSQALWFVFSCIVERRNYENAPSGTLDLFENMISNMKKKTAVLSAIALLSVLLLTHAAAQSRPAPALDFTPHTAALLLVDMNTGQTVYSRNADKVRSMASLTKIMTYIVTAEAVGDLEGTMMEILDEPLDDIRGRGASVAGLEEYIGTSMPVLDVLYALMVPSGCDAGAELAWFVGGGDMQSFVDRMNEKAAELGCEDTHYTDSHGLSGNNLTTARDLYKIASYAMGLPHFWEVVNTTHYTLPDAPAPMFTTVRIMDPVNGGQYYYRYAHGIKTGFTYQAGRCLISTATKGEASYMCIALGGEYSAATDWKNTAMTDTAALYRWAFGNFTDSIEVDIPQRFASVQLGDTLALSADVVRNNTGKTAHITWTSSDPEIAGVDENGVVTAYALGQAIITAESQTGDFDTCAVSAGFYNGIHVTSDSVDHSGGTEGPVDWSAVKGSGLDYAVIRAGWGREDAACRSDADLEFNAAQASRYGVPFGVSFTAAAVSPEQAQAEAEFVLGKLEDLTFLYPLSLPVVYDMSDARFQSLTAEQNTEIALAFHGVMASRGYETACYGNKALFSNMHLDALAAEGMGLWYRFWPYVMDFSEAAGIGAVLPQAWHYRSDLYFPEASQSNSADASLIYMASALAGHMEAPSVVAALSEDGRSALLHWTVPDGLFSGFAVYRREADSDTVEELARLGPSARRYPTYGDGGTYLYTVAGLLGDCLGGTAEAAGEGVSVRFTSPVPERFWETPDGGDGALPYLAGGAILVLAAGGLLGAGRLGRKRKHKVRR